MAQCRDRQTRRSSARRSSAASTTLGAISETPDHLTRIFLTPEHRAAADLLLSMDAGGRHGTRISMRSAMSAAVTRASVRACRA